VPSDINCSSLWFNGPPFLLQDPAEWPKTPRQEKKLPELRKTLLISTTLRNDITLGIKFVISFPKILRVFAYIHKFVYHIKSNGLSVVDVCNSTRMFIRTFQLSQMASDV